MNCFYAHVAQSAEHILGKDEVTGSIPVMGSSYEYSRTLQAKERLAGRARRRNGKGKI